MVILVCFRHQRQNMAWIWYSDSNPVFEKHICLKYTVNFSTLPGFSSWQMVWIKTGECVTLGCKLYVPPSDKNTWAPFHSLSHGTLLYSVSQFYNCSVCRSRRLMYLVLDLYYLTHVFTFICSYISSLKRRMWVYENTCWITCLCVSKCVCVHQFLNQFTDLHKTGSNVCLRRSF
jgi:hypothetical protein